jgi:glycerol uptake facilitator-like aquaporin
LALVFPKSFLHNNSGKHSISSWSNLWIYLAANFGAAAVAAFVFNLINPPSQVKP